MVKVGEMGVHQVSRCPGQFRIEDRGRWHGPDAWLARAGRRVLLRREIARVLRWFGMPSEHNCGAWRGNTEGLYDRHLYVCIVRRKRGLHCESALLVNTGTLADARTHNQGARMWPVGLWGISET